MSLLITAARRSLLLVLLATTLGATYAWWRDRDESGLAPAQWPPIDPSARPATTATSSASFVNALVDAPEARTTDGATTGWTTPGDDGSCPLDHPVKANDNSGIFHVPGGRFYDRTKAERCYSNQDAALADGYRRAKN